MRREFITFAAGAVLSAVGLAPIPVSEAFLTAGAALISLSYGAVILGWRTGKSTSQLKLPGVAPASQPSTQPSTPKPQPAYTPAPPPTFSPTASASSAVKPSVTPPPPPSPPSPPSMTSPPQTPPVPTSAPAPSPPTVQQEPPAYAAPAPPTSPSYEQPKPPGRKLPSVKAPKIPSLKAPKIQLPKSVVENKIPVVLLGAGLIVLIAGLLVLGVPPQPLVGIGLLIPGGLFFGLGAILLYQRLRPRVVEVVTRRFCMHCGFEMSSTDVSCGRCHRQPPSGVDTKVCPNCTAVIPTLAKFCRDCGAGQPTGPQ